MKVKEGLLTIKDLKKELEGNGIDISYSGIYYWLKVRFIPTKFVIKKKRARKTLYYFKPEVVDYLVKKLS